MKRGGARAQDPVGAGDREQVGGAAGGIHVIQIGAGQIGLQAAVVGRGGRLIGRLRRLEIGGLLRGGSAHAVGLVDGKVPVGLGHGVEISLRGGRRARHCVCAAGPHGVDILGLGRGRGLLQRGGGIRRGVRQHVGGHAGRRRGRGHFRQIVRIDRLLIGGVLAVDAGRVGQVILPRAAAGSAPPALLGGGQAGLELGPARRAGAGKRRGHGVQGAGGGRVSGRLPGGGGCGGGGRLGVIGCRLGVPVAGVRAVARQGLGIGHALRSRSLGRAHRISLLVLGQVHGQGLRHRRIGRGIHVIGRGIGLLPSQVGVGLPAERAAVGQVIPADDEILFGLGLGGREIGLGIAVTVD